MATSVLARVPARPRRPRLVLAVALAVAAIVVASLPALAAWPVGSRSSYVSQWSHSRHRAIDIASSKGTKVLPIGNGRVVFAGWRSNCGGYQVWVDHGNGRYSAYYHLSRETTYRGDRVRGQLDVIGYVGTSGCSSGPHLHVEVWKGYPWRSGSYRINPWGFIDEGTYLPSRYR